MEQEQLTGDIDTSDFERPPVTAQASVDNEVFLTGIELAARLAEQQQGFWNANANDQ